MGTLVVPPDPPSLTAIPSPQSSPLPIPQPQIGQIPSNPLQISSISPQLINPRNQTSSLLNQSVTETNPNHHLLNPNSQLPQEIPIIPPIQTKSWSSIFNVSSLEEKEKLEYVEPIFENGILQIEDEVLEEGMEEWKDKLVGYFVDEKVSPTLVKNFLKNRWKLLGEVEIKMDEELYYFTFYNKEDRKKVLEEGSIHISGKYFVICSWSENLENEKKGIKTILIWVKFAKLPKHLWNGKGLSRIASSIGKPMFMDKGTEEKKILAFARVFIEVQATKELPDSIHVKVSKTATAIVNVEYSWKPRICINCQTFGHETIMCSKNPAAITQPPQPYSSNTNQNQYQNNRLKSQNIPKKAIQHSANDGYNRGRNWIHKNWRGKERGEASGVQGKKDNTSNKFNVLLDCVEEGEFIDIEKEHVGNDIGVLENPIECERQEEDEEQTQTIDNNPRGEITRKQKDTMVMDVRGEELPTENHDGEDSHILEEDMVNQNATVTDPTIHIPLPKNPTQEPDTCEPLNNTNEIELVIETPSSLPKSRAEEEADLIEKRWEERQRKLENDKAEELAKKGVEASKEPKQKGKGKKGKQKTVKISSLEDIEEECMEDDVLLKNYLMR